ncbi:MAG: sugar ABC transporter permease [Chloroflexi bacterium]|nr:sugar ABC transporter permease [Chloroflexota bacterium]
MPSYLLYEGKEHMQRIHGWRKFLYVLAFIGPTILGILVFSVYPIIYNTYISFTNRNVFHANPDCSAGLNSIIEPTCWPVFKEHALSGMGSLFQIQMPLFKNYITLLGTIFTPIILLALLRVLLCFIPLLIASLVNRHYRKEYIPPVSRSVVTLIGVALTVILFLVGSPAESATLTQTGVPPYKALLLDGPTALGLVTNSGDFFIVVFRTVLYVICCIPLFFIIGLILALLLNVKNLPGRSFFRVALIVPWAASNVAIMMSLVWKFFFQEVGTVNQMTKLLFNAPPVLWLNDPTIAFAVCVLANIWYSYPFFMVTILGALQSIPTELYEASEVDGAGWWQQLFQITLPLIRPAVIPIIVLSSITTFQMFGTVYAITGGGPSLGAGVPGITDFVMVYAYKQVLQSSNYGLMGAFAVIIFIMLFIATILSLRITRITKGAEG